MNGDMTMNVADPGTGDIREARRAFLCLSHSPFMTLPGKENAGERYRGAVENAKRFVAGFRPDVVVMFAPDHMNLLNELRPPFTGILSGSTLPEFGIPELALTVHPLATDLYQQLVAADVDLAVGEEVKVDHGLGLTLLQLFDEPGSAPLIPIIVNAIGFPLFPVRRAAWVGAQVGRVLGGYQERVLFVGTGGLSHEPPFPPPAPGAKRLTPEEREKSIAGAMDFVDPVWDRDLLDRMAAGDAGFFNSVTQAEIDPRGVGANEIRTWAAAWAAAGSTKAVFTSYELVEPWITGMGVAFGAGALLAPVQTDHMLAGRMPTNG